jgi:uncharacterized protein (DUF983 family)
MTSTPPSQAVQRALSNRCPACGGGVLFASWLKTHPRCSSCGLDFSALEVGDGAAVFGIFLVSIILVVSFLVVTINLAPPLWFQLTFWPALGLGLSLLSLRVARAVLIALTHVHGAGEGQRDD